MEENAVMNIAEPTEETTAPVDAEQGESIADLLGIEQQEESAEPVEGTEVDAPQQEEQPGQQNQKDIDRAFQLERQRIENKYQRQYEQQLQADPARQVGMQLIEDIMRATGAPMEQAVRMAGENLVNAIAKRENISPGIARALIQRQQPQQPQQQEPDVYSKAMEIHRELASIELPEGFDFNTAIQDQGFAEMLLRMPTETAIWRYQAEQARKRAQAAPQEMAERLKARAAIPQAMKPQQPVTPKVDFSSMTDDEFFEFDSKL